MESKARLLGHPVHPMLIVFPLGLLATAVAFDIVSLVQSDPSWFRTSFWMIAAESSVGCAQQSLESSTGSRYLGARAQRVSAYIMAH